MSHVSLTDRGLAPAQHPTSKKQFTLTDDQADALRAEHARVRALHQRSMKSPAAARQLKLSFTTVEVLRVEVRCRYSSSAEVLAGLRALAELTC